MAFNRRSMLFGCSALACTEGDDGEARNLHHDHVGIVDICVR